MKHWWCAECQAKVNLGKHGRCEVCESEAVDRISQDTEVNRSVSMERSDSDSALVHA